MLTKLHDQYVLYCPASTVGPQDRVPCIKMRYCSPRRYIRVWPTYAIQSPPALRAQLFRRCDLYARKSASQAILNRMRLALYATRRTAHGASRLGQTFYAWSVKPRRAPLRHYRDARAYVRTTTAMHDKRTRPRRFPPRCVQ